MILICEFCGHTYETLDEEEVDLDDMSGAHSLPCPKCLRTMWEEEDDILC